MNRSKLKPALIGGIAEGVASSVPFLGLANVACCALVVGGGVLAAYLYMKDAPPSAQAPLGDGLKLGLLAGLIGGLVYTLILIPMSLLGLEMLPGMSEALENADLPPEVASMLGSGGFSLGMILLALIFGLIIDPIFAGIGGVIGVAIFNKKPAVTQGREPRADSPLDILKRRYAGGEIDKDEYEARKKDLS